MNAEGRIITLYYKVRLAPNEVTPVGETDSAEQIADELLKTGSAKLKEVCIPGYKAEISTAFFIF